MKRIGVHEERGTVGEHPRICWIDDSLARISAMSIQRLEYLRRIESCHSLVFPASSEANEHKTKACSKPSPASSVNWISKGISSTI
jgi:hypothetical protein